MLQAKLSRSCACEEHPVGPLRLQGQFITGIFLLFSSLISTPALADLSRRHLGSFVSHFEPVNYDLRQARLEHKWALMDSHGGPQNVFRLDIPAFNRTFHLVLSEDKELFAEDVQFLTANGEEFAVDTSQHLIGHVGDEEKSHAHGSLAGGRFRGVIDVGEETYHVEPSGAFFDHPQTFHSVMYRDTDVNHTKALRGHPLDIRAVAEQLVAEKRQKYSQDERQKHSRAKRQLGDPMNNVECRIAVIGDHYFAALAASMEAIPISDKVGIRSAMTRIMALFVREANKIFQTTTFLSTSSAPEGVRLAISSVRTFVTEAEMKLFNNGNTKLTQGFLGPSSVLEEMGKAQWDAYCLAHLFTNREFSEGVLGLAYVGGMCRQFSASRKATFNVGMFTFSNEGNRIPSATSRLVYVHEAGHNFGAEHDVGAACLPSDAMGGKYVMYTNANDGSYSNNRLFSPCSRFSIGQALKLKAFVHFKHCFFPASNGSLCGNLVREGDEPCDCGTVDQCAKEGFCCQHKCKLAGNSACSPQQGPCCSSSSCSFLPANGTTFCSDPHECRLGRTKCTGNSSTCPIAPAQRNGLVCNKGRSTCSDGECTGSLCAAFNLKRCFCPGGAACHVCCEHKGKCLSLTQLAQSKFNITGLQLFLPAGSPCNDFAGYCNFLHFCRSIGDTSAFLVVQKFLFSSSTYAGAYRWIKEFWWATTLIGFGLIIVFTLVIKYCSYKTPQTIKDKSVRKLAPSVTQDHSF